MAGEITRRRLLLGGRLNNVFFPVWLLFLFPPLILVSLLVNFLVDSAVIIFGLRGIGVTDWKPIYKATWWKVWLLGFLADIIGAAFFGTNNSRYWQPTAHPALWIFGISRQSI